MFLKLIKNRRSIRNFIDKKIEEDKIEALKEAALRSPSSRSLNPWEFIFIDDPDILENLSRSKPQGSSFLKKAKLGIAVIADPEKCDVWIEDCAIASTYIQLAAESLGLASCWSQIRKRENQTNRSAENFVKRLLEIPKEYKVLSIIGIGYPVQKPEPHNEEYVTNQMLKIHMNKF